MGLRAARYIAVFACLAYPWLHAGARGPTPAVEPLLVALCCVVLLQLRLKARSTF